MNETQFSKSVERWDVFEYSCRGPKTGNPFTERRITGVFTSENETATVDGFYDGDGVYRVRFMPSFTGDYRFAVTADFLDIPVSGAFRVTPAGSENHGPVRVANACHFAHEDGTPYYPVGTTCYVWELQSDTLQRRTLESLADGPFNKIRFCIFPKHYDYNLNEPRSYPYEGTPMDSSVLTKENFYQYSGNPEGNHFDYTRFNPEHFQHIEGCILALRGLGIEADLIVMHPYDRWGFCQMDAACDALYWNYVVARFAAYRNVWWSLANEYDLMSHKSISDWESYAAILCKKDPYRHLRSIHNCKPFYDYSRPWVTHCSIQRQDIYKTAEYTDEWRERYQKPVVLDEIAYEGNIQHGWGNITGQEMTRRFWEAACRGGYAGHGETYLNESGILWWSHGGVLHGDSPGRLKFLLKILKQTPGYGLKRWERTSWDEVAAVADQFADGGYYLFYYSFMRPSFRDFDFKDHENYSVEVIDTWETTIEDRGVHSGRFRVELPGKPYMAIRIRRTA
ncbi:MAG: DUF5605 domain-containing protein [Clostridiales bacterium]|jgi:hypothetical protein|nr:DUF5605 domain-containing protein [Clostridiales bacterium]